MVEWGFDSETLQQQTLRIAIGSTALTLVVTLQN